MVPVCLRAVELWGDLQVLLGGLCQCLLLASSAALSAPRGSFPHALKVQSQAFLLQTESIAHLFLVCLATLGAHKPVCSGAGPRLAGPACWVSGEAVMVNNHHLSRQARSRFLAWAPDV